MIKRIKSTKAQMKMSFGMIFSIILIIIFLGVAFYGIKFFLGMQTQMQIKQFENSLQGDVDKMWKSTKGTQEQEYILPKKITKICFTDNEDENLFYECDNFIEPAKINHINIGEITKDGDFCIKNFEGKIKLTIEKSYGENLVMIVQ